MTWKSFLSQIKLMNAKITPFLKSVFPPSLWSGSSMTYKPSVLDSLCYQIPEEIFQKNKNQGGRDLKSAAIFQFDTQ